MNKSKKNKKEGYFASIKRRDPAARHNLQILLTYPCIRVLIYYKIARFFRRLHLLLISEWIMQCARRRTNIEIHPGATIGKNLFIDHGTGVVIGETAIIGNNVTIYHGVTLGGRSLNKGKRHPTIGNDVVIGCNASVLGNISIGNNARIGANALVVDDVPENEVIYGTKSN